MAANIIFVGGDGDVQTFTWGGLEFTRGAPVLVDPEAAETAEQRQFLEYMIRKAATHPYLTVEEVGGPVKRQKTKHAEGDEDNGTEIAGEIPPDWKDMHHKKVIALAKRLGGEGDALATRDGAIDYIELYLAAQSTEGATGD